MLMCMLAFRALTLVHLAIHALIAPGAATAPPPASPA
jgi:hypothetical protein